MEDADAVREEVKEKVIKNMQNEEFLNMDLTNISMHLKKRMHVISEDLQNLVDDVQLERSHEVLVNMTDPEFLAHQRAESETKLIKAAILYRLYNNLPLSKQQKDYHSLWKKSLGQKSMVPFTHSSVKLGDLSPEAIYHLETLKNVKLQGLEEYGVNDLCVEISHLLCPDQMRIID